MAKLFLDDVRPCPEGFDLVRSYDEFVTYIETKGVPEFISFDHDLAEEHYPWNAPSSGIGKSAYDGFKEKTGYHCLVWLLNRCLENGQDPPAYAIHTMNYVGRVNMEMAYRLYKSERERRLAEHPTENGMHNTETSTIQEHQARKGD